MAQHTESTMTGIRPYRTNFGSTPIRGYPESANSTFSYGDLVMLNSGTNTHRIVAASSLSTEYVGVAAEGASSNQDNNVPVFEARDPNLFLGWVKETIASTMVGQFRSFARDTSKAIDYLAVNSSLGTEQRAQIVEVGLQDVAGGPYNINDTNGYVVFRFLPPFTAFGQSTTSS